MEENLSIDDDRTAWDTAWRDRPLRRLVNQVQIDVSPTPNDDWGDITQVDIAIDPPQFETSVWRKDDICPVCGRTTTGESSRLAVNIYPYFSKGFSYGLGAWAHESCFASCEEVPDPAPIPW
ncbi:MAG: hypothetical protein ABR568_03755 [Pyrinomonadaceae bacterium]